MWMSPASVIFDGDGGDFSPGGSTVGTKDWPIGQKIALVLSSTCCNYIPFLVFSYLNFIPSIRKRLERE
jgi:hypothetical protein